MKDKRRTYMVILFIVSSILWFDVTIFGMPLNIVVVLAATLLMLIWDMWDRQKSKEPMFDGLSCLDIVVYLIGLLSVISLIGKIIYDPSDYCSEMFIVTLVLMYYLLHKKLTVTENQVMVFSIFGMTINTLLLWHYLVDASFDFMIQTLLQNDLSVTWLMLVITVNAAAYCIYDAKWFWHGANVVVAFFLLLIQKNLISLILTMALFFVIPFIYRPVKQLVKRDMQMFLICAFMLCNMSLITGYTTLFDEALGLNYDLEISVYLELLLSVFGVFFFSFWEKLDEEDLKENVRKAKTFFGKTSTILMILTLAFAGVLMRGSSSIMPEMINKLITEIRESAASQSSLLMVAGGSYGIFGAVLAVYFLYSILDSIRMQKKKKSTRQQKFMQVVALMFVLQSIFLTQSMAITIIYLVFVITCVNNTRIPVRISKEVNSDEADNTDPMLQRSSDLGDSAQRPSEET